MAKVTLQPGFEDLCGAIGDLVFKRSASGKLIVTKRPDMTNVQWSEAQLAQRERFQEAFAYATAALADPKLRLKYQKRAAKAKVRPRDLAIPDYFNGKNLLEEK